MIAVIKRVLGVRPPCRRPHCSGRAPRRAAQAIFWHQTMHHTIQCIVHHIAHRIKDAPRCLRYLLCCRLQPGLAPNEIRAMLPEVLCRTDENKHRYIDYKKLLRCEGREDAKTKMVAACDSMRSYPWCHLTGSRLAAF